MAQRKTRPGASRTTASRPRGNGGSNPGARRRTTPPPPEATNRDPATAPGVRRPVPGAGVTDRSTAETRGRGGGSGDAGRGRGAARRGGAGARLDAPGDLAGPRGSAGPAARDTADPNFTAASPRAKDPPRTASRGGGESQRVDGTQGAGGTQGSGAGAVADVMTRDLEVATPDTELYYVARMMAERDVGAIPVVESTDGMRPLGIVTDRDITVRVIAKRTDPNDVRARDVMSGELLTVREDAALQECLDQMEDRRVRRALVTDRSGRLVGIVAQADVARLARGDDAGELVREVSRPPGNSA